LKCFTHSRSSSSVVQPLLLTAITQSSGRSQYQLAWCSLPDRMTKGGIDQPDALIHSIVVAQLQLPGWTTVARPIVSELVTTFDVAATSIINPISSKLYESLSSIPYVTSKTHHWVSAKASGHGQSSYGSWADRSRASRFIFPPGSLFAPLISSTTLNHAPILTGSSHRALCEWNFLFHFV
jgi:hypothetical protein